MATENGSANKATQIPSLGFPASETRSINPEGTKGAMKMAVSSLAVLVFIASIGFLHPRLYSPLVRQA